MTIRYEMKFKDKGGTARTHQHDGELSSAASIAGLLAQENDSRVEVAELDDNGKRKVVVTVEAP